MEQVIKQKLRDAEEMHNVTITYACESGSRAWGFASIDSDYDARFIYVHDKEHYLDIDDHNDVIELPIDEVFDINGWELRKALKLFRKSNAPLFEWLQSPIVYQSNFEFHRELKALMPKYFSPRSMFHHYLGMTKPVMDGRVFSEREIKLKKYFYALRPLLACKWIIEFNETPPMEFGKLRALLDVSLNGIVDDLIGEKSKADEKSTITPIAELNLWLYKQQEYFKGYQPITSEPIEDNADLNQLFRRFIK